MSIFHQDDSEGIVKATGGQLIPFKMFMYLFYSKGRKRQSHQEFSYTLVRFQKAHKSQGWAKSPELHQVFSHELQGLKYLGHHSCLPLCVASGKWNLKQKQNVKPGTQEWEVGFPPKGIRPCLFFCSSFP